MFFKNNISEYTKNVLTLVTGTSIAQFIPIAISPILTRIYSPEDFGVLTLFMSISLIFGSISSARYEMAIMLPEKDEDALSISFLAVFISFFFSLIIFIALFFFKDLIFIKLNNSKLGLLIYLCPLLVFLIGLYNVLINYNNRKKKYKDIAKANIYKSITMSSVQLVFPVIKSGSIGLIIGYFLSHISSNLQLIKNFFVDREMFKKINKNKVLKLGSKYIKFPKYSMPATLANIMSTQFVNILISSFFGLSTLGFYSLVQKVLGMPISIIGSSISQVYYQESVRMNLKEGNSYIVIKKTVLKLILIGIPIFSILFFIIEDLFEFVYGVEWRIAGEYSKILIFLFFLRFISSTVSLTLSVYQKQEFELIINLLLLIFGVSLIYLFKDDFKEYLIYYSILIGGLYAVFLLYYFELSKGQKNKYL